MKASRDAAMTCAVYRMSASVFLGGQSRLKWQTIALLARNIDKRVKNGSAVR
ncbi:MAG: hypothetical protein ACHQ2Z_00270 [Elusimicrobiota bacterium]